MSRFCYKPGPGSAQRRLPCRRKCIGRARGKVGMGGAKARCGRRHERWVGTCTGAVLWCIASLMIRLSLCCSMRLASMLVDAIVG
eukprot:1158432-Pelagomonas_calceolata.AAC.3